MARLLVNSLGVPALLILFALALCPPVLGAEQTSGAATCEVRVDLQYEMRPGTVVRTPVGEVAPFAAQVIINKAGQMHWDELTKHGKKYLGICLDHEHPYYVLVWQVTDYDATAELDVVDNGCLVVS